MVHHLKLHGYEGSIYLNTEHYAVTNTLRKHPKRWTALGSGSRV